MSGYLDPRTKQPMWSQTTGPIGDYSDIIETETLVEISYAPRVPFVGAGGVTPSRVHRVVGLIIGETPTSIRVSVFPRNTQRDQIKDYEYHFNYYGPFSHQTITIPKELIEHVIEDDTYFLLTPRDLLPDD